jgi:hypothetical protein
MKDERLSAGTVLEADDRFYPSPAARTININFKIEKGS